MAPNKQRDQRARIQVYKIIDPQNLMSAGDRLLTVFAGRPADNQMHLSISGDGGRWWFFDDRVLGPSAKERPSDGPVSPEVAARAFVGKVNQAVAGDSRLTATGIRGFFPNDLRPSVITLIKGPDGRAADHWLVRFEVYLPSGARSGSLPVYGATADFRMTLDGTVGGFWLAWRPSLPVGLVPFIPMSTGQNPGSTDDSAPSILTYRLADEGCAQSFICPYYFIANDDDGDFFPASSYSLVAKIVDDPQPSSPRLAAFVSGGSGNYAYKWMSWDLKDPLSGYTDQGTDDAVGLEQGEYNMVLAVTDVQYGAVVMVQRLVFTGMMSSTRITT